ncbi:MAG: hypothetical protein EOO24_52765 [Comamonadaceae bacterium]|nr:MAG: hypothetical protein EOO24_52765 [Comamonadaceae bacterium]
MDPLTLSLIATIAGSGLQMYSANQAAQRQQQAAMESQRRQLTARNQATQIAAKTANDFDPTQRAQNLADATQEQTQRFEGVNAQPAITAQGVQVGSTLPAGAGGNDYALAKASETAKTQASLHALAGLMGRMGNGLATAGLGVKKDITQTPALWLNG